MPRDIPLNIIQYLVVQVLEFVISVIIDYNIFLRISFRN